MTKQSFRVDASGWSVRRIDIRSPLARHRGHLARVELEHPTRGRVTDMGSGLDIIAAALAAVAHILGCEAKIVSLNSSHRNLLCDDDPDPAMAAIVVDCGGRRHRGTATGQDVIYACLGAFIDALASSERSDSVGRLAESLNVASDADLLAARHCQVSGIDENGDFWLFASDDAGAAEAIATEFQDEEFTQVQLSIPGSGSAPSGG